MKKNISFLFAIVFVLSFSVLSYAEEIPEYNWTDTEPIARQSLGMGNTWYIEEIDASFWLPADFSPVELTAEDLADGCIGFYSVLGSDLYVLLNYADSQGLTLDSYLSYLQQNSADVYKLTINGIPALYLREADKDTALLIFQTQAGKLFQVVFSPLAAEEMFQFTAISIRPCVEEADVSGELVVPVNPVSGLISK